MDSLRYVSPLDLETPVTSVQRLPSLFFFFPSSPCVQASFPVFRGSFMNYGTDPFLVNQHEEE